MCVRVCVCGVCVCVCVAVESHLQRDYGFPVALTADLDRLLELPALHVAHTDVSASKPHPINKTQPPTVVHVPISPTAVRDVLVCIHERVLNSMDVPSQALHTKLPIFLCLAPPPRCTTLYLHPWENGEDRSGDLTSLCPR